MSDAKVFRQGKFELDKISGAWTPDGDVVSALECAVTVDGKEYRLAGVPLTLGGDAPRLTVSGTFENPGFKWTLAFELRENTTALSYYFEIENIGAKPLVIGDCRICRFSGETGRLALGPNPEDATFFDFRDTLGNNFVRKVSDARETRWSRCLCHLSGPVSGKTFFIGALTYDKTFVRFDLVFNPEKKRVETLEGTMPFNDFQLLPGKKLASEKLYMEVASDGPFRVLEEWASMVNAIYRPNLPEQSSAGWCGWAWVDGFKTEAPESIMERNSKAIRKRLAGFGVKYIWNSISNLKDGLPGNWLSPNADFFPNGLDRAIRNIKKRGFVPGFWVGPFYMCEGSDDFERNRGNLLHDADNVPRAQGGWLWAAKAKENALPALYGLDPSHPDTEKYLREVFRAYRKWGVHYFMLDFLTAGLARQTDVPSDPSKVKGWEAYRNCMAAIREAAGPETRLLSAVGSTLGHVGTISASRIGMDYGEGRQLMPRFASYPANYVINGSYGSSGSPNINAVQNLACWYFAHRKFFLCDSNLMTVDKPIPRNEALITASLFGISGGPMMLGDDIDTISEERLALIKKCLPRANSAPIPADLFTNVTGDNRTRIFVVPVRKSWGEWSVVAVFNLDEDYRRVELNAAASRLDPAKTYRAFDFWEERYRGTLKGAMTVEVAGSSCAVFRFEEAKDHPWILSTDTHVRQGEVELLDLRWDVENLTLSGSIARPKGEVGNIYLIAPPGWKEKHLNKGLWVAKSAIDDSLIIRKEIKFASAEERWSVEFERFNAEENEWRETHLKKRPKNN